MGFQKTYALIVGIVLALIGIGGLFTKTLLVFNVNLPHSILHLIAGAFGIYVGLKGTGSTYNMVIGVVGTLLGILGFVPGTKDLLMTYLNCNPAVKILHLVIGVVTLIVRFAVKETEAQPAMSTPIQ